MISLTTMILTMLEPRDRQEQVRAVMHATMIAQNQFSANDAPWRAVSRILELLEASKCEHDDVTVGYILDAFDSNSVLREYLTPVYFSVMGFSEPHEHDQDLLRFLDENTVFVFDCIVKMFYRPFVGSRAEIVSDSALKAKTLRNFNEALLAPQRKEIMKAARRAFVEMEQDAVSAWHNTHTVSFGAGFVTVTKADPLSPDGIFSFNCNF